MLPPHYARDYATLVAVELDVAGKYSDYLLLYRWSTVDTRMSAPPDPRAGHAADRGRWAQSVLSPLAQLPVDAGGRAELYYPSMPTLSPTPTGRSGDAALHRASRQITVCMPQDPLDTPFGLWEDGRASLAQFVQDEGVVK